MNKLEKLLIMATDDAGLVCTADEARAAYYSLAEKIKLLQKALETATEARKAGAATPVLMQVETLLNAALNG